MSVLIAEKMLPGGARISLRRGDLTEEAVEAIVNAANEFLQHGGGVAGAISRKGGPVIQRESDAIGHTPTGTAAITGAGLLAARFVIHAVGPVWSRYEESEADRLLESAVESSLELAAARGLTSVALPAISGGIYGYLKDRCARVMLRAVFSWADGNATESVKDIRMILIDEQAVAAFQEAWRAGIAAQNN